MGRGTSLAVQWLRGRGHSSTPGQGTKILHAKRHSQKKEECEEGEGPWSRHQADKALLSCQPRGLRFNHPQTSHRDCDRASVTCREPLWLQKGLILLGRETSSPGRGVRGQLWASESVCCAPPADLGHLSLGPQGSWRVCAESLLFMQAFCSSDPTLETLTAGAAKEQLCESLIHLPMLRSHKGARLSAGCWCMGAHSLRGTADAVGPTRHEIPDYGAFKPSHSRLKVDFL